MIFHDRWEEATMIEYRCAVHGLAAPRQTTEEDAPRSCPDCGGRIWKWINEEGKLRFESSPPRRD
jgi:DNA-directed RNA polymerase subunit RPC12/RpoP